MKAKKRLDDAALRARTRIDIGTCSIDHANWTLSESTLLKVRWEHMKHHQRSPIAAFSFAVTTLLALTGVIFAVQLSGLEKAWTKVEYDSAQLMMKNAEQVTELVKRKIKKAQDIQAAQQDDDDAGIQAEPDAVEQLQNAVRLILSRPDQDGARSNIFARLRRELVDLNAFDDVLKELTSEAIKGIQDSATHSKHQATYIVLLENLMAEVKPDLKSNAHFKTLVETIRDANLKVPDKVIKNQRMRTMSKPVSPSETAAKILPKSESKK